METGLEGLVCLAIVASLGCGDTERRDAFGSASAGIGPFGDDGDGAGGDETGDGGTDGGGDDRPDSGGGDGPMGTDDDGGDAEPPSDGGPAEGIVVTDIEANQGVGVAIVAGGAVLPAAQRNAELIHGRKTLVRAGWQLDPAFAARSIEARLILTRPDGSTETLVTERSVSADSNMDAEQSAFQWVLEPEMVVPGLGYHVELYEAGTSPEMSGATAYPGPSSPLEVTSGPMTIKFVAIPVTTPGGGIVVTPQLEENLHKRLLATFPAQSIDVTWRAPWNRSSKLSQESEAWDYMTNARAQDGAGVSYYFLILDGQTCCDESGGQFTWAGKAQLIDEESLDYGAYGDGMSKLYDPSGALLGVDSVITHELGHNHGRQHAPCGDPANVDPAFPYPGAVVGTRGYDITTDEFIPANDPMWGERRDFMSYCGTEWWTDYSWRALTDRIELRSLMHSQGAPAWDGTEARAYLDGHGGVRWSLVPAPHRANGGTVTDAVLRDEAGAIIESRSVVITEIAESDETIAHIDIADADAFDRLELAVGDRVYTVREPELRRSRPAAE